MLSGVKDVALVPQMTASRRSRRRETPRGSTSARLQGNHQQGRSTRLARGL